MGWRTARWLGLVLLAAGTGCGSSSRSPNSEESHAGSGGATAGSAGTAGAFASGGAGAAGTAGAGAAGAGASGGAGAGAAGAGGTAGASGAAGEAGSSGLGGSAGDSAGTGGVAGELCPEAPAPRLGSGTVIELPIELTFGGSPLVFAETNPLPGGGTLTPLGVRFYLSEVALLRDGADPLPVDIVTSTGTVAPYGVYFFNADDVTSTTLRVLAPMGEYAGITFLWGLEQSCNTRSGELSGAPLSPTSQMTWPHTGFLFFRYEGRTAFPDPGSGGAGGAEADAEGGAGEGGGAGDPASLYPSVIHMGGNLFEPLAPVIRLEGELSVPATGPIQKELRVAVDEIFEGALADIDLTAFAGPPGEEVLLGERLRRSVPSLTVFSFEP
jgi:hypothetical protein